jgi:hypothetical protein
MKIAFVRRGGVDGRLRRAAVSGALAVLAAFGAAAGSQEAKTIPSLSIQLVAPGPSTVVPRYGTSPVFTWKIDAHGLPTPKGSGRLELSTTRSFAQEAVYRFDCGYSAGDCVPHFRWPNVSPHWYDMANACSDVPPEGTGCGSLSTVLYWRVRFEPVGGRSYTSPIGVLSRSAPASTAPPTAKAEGGSSDYGGPARMLFWASDPSNLVRYVVQLYDGTKMVFGARTDWRTISGNYYTYVDLPLPPSVGPGAYKFCVTVIDQSDNDATDCAPYSITQP